MKTASYRHIFKYTGIFKLFGVAASEHVVSCEQYFARIGVDNIVAGEAAVNSLSEGLNDLVALFDFMHQNTVVSAAVVLADNNLL